MRVRVNPSVIFLIGAGIGMYMSTSDGWLTFTVVCGLLTVMPYMPRE